MPRRPPRRQLLTSRVAASSGGYRTVLSVSGVRPIALASLIARLPKGMLPLALVLVLHEGSGGFAVAGLAVAAVAIGDAVSSPWQGRLMDRHGRGRVLLPTVILHALAGTGLLLLRESPGATVACAALAGIGMPPVSGAIKAIWSRLVGPDRAPAAYGLESLIQQVMFGVGPLLVAVITLLGTAEMTLIVSMVLSVVGTGWFTWSTRAIGVPASAGRAPEQRVLRVPIVAVMCSCTLLQGITFGANPVGLTAAAAAAGVPALVGVLQGATSLGGLIGTFAMAPIQRSAQFVRGLGWYAVVLLPPVALCLWPNAATLAALTVVLVIPGLFLTPLAAGSYLLVDRGTHPAQRTEAFTWLSTSLAIGTAVGAGLAGLLGDAGGAPPALALSPAAVVVAAVLARRIPTAA